ncbi:hypothetical protein ACLQ3K_03855 [Tsukamurella sp. DT100]|uniref:hypothetical protein n=1 Tax=Tsukamurella sp. DT100 TaxID=3393415 RepID=UPI003CE83431
MTTRASLRTTLTELVSAWWFGGPTYDERITYLRNRSLLGLIRAAVSICAFLLGLMSIGLLINIAPLSTPVQVRLVVCAVVAAFWAVRWQVGPLPGAREAAVFVATSIIAIYGARRSTTRWASPSASRASR